MKLNDHFVLEKGARIAVVGGGPSGSFASIFALKMARLTGKAISLTIFEPKDFCRCGPIGCNHCGGVVSELLVQTLAVEGLNLPDEVLQRGINGYRLHTTVGSVAISTPSLENSIATVHRGAGPLGVDCSGKTSFDGFLLQEAIKLGATHRAERVDGLVLRDAKPALICGKTETEPFDLVVCASGIKSPGSHFLETAGIGYHRPWTVTAAIVEVDMDPDFLAKTFGNAIQLFLLPIENVKFAAIIPKGNYATVCLLGKGMNHETVERFLDHKLVRKVFPSDWSGKPCCRCLPKMNIGAPRVPFSDRVVVCGDAGSTRLFKDGIGAAYLMGKAVATTAILQGVSAKHFRRFYLPVYRSIIRDNHFGRYLFAATELYKKYPLLTRAMVRVLRQEQSRAYGPKRLSTILWNIFSGNERYKKIFAKAMNLPMHLDIWDELFTTATRQQPC